MINNAAECRDFALLLESYRREGRQEDIANNFKAIKLERKKGHIGHFSMRTVFENVVPDGHNVVRAMQEQHRAHGSSNVIMEAGGDTVTTADFSNIIGQVAFSDVLENFESPDLVGGQLVRERPATTAQREMIPGIAMIGERSSDVGEGEEYPYVGLSGQHVTLPEVVKDGFILPITEEAIFEDKTGQLLEQANKAAESMAITQEKERLGVVLGTSADSYSRNDGPLQATYANTHTQGTFDNLSADTDLVDYTSIESAKDLFNDLTDPETGEPIFIGGSLQIVVPDELEFTLMRILSPLMLEQGAISATVPRAGFSNPIHSGRRSYTGVSSQYISSVGSTTNTWWIGKFTEAFVERVVYPTQVMVEDRNSHTGFSRDIVTRIKVRRKSQTGVLEPRKVIKCTAS